MDTIFYFPKDAPVPHGKTAFEAQFPCVGGSKQRLHDIQDIQARRAVLLGFESDSICPSMGLSCGKTALVDTALALRGSSFKKTARKRESSTTWYATEQRTL